MTSDIYKPAGCNTLAEANDQQVRLGIQGFPGTGKTVSSLTFPNPMVLNLDRGLGYSQGRADVIEVPMYGGDRTTIKDRLIQWLDQHGSKISSEQTLTFDTCSAIEAAYHSWFRKNELNLALGRSGKVNEFVEWNLKETYFEEIFQSIRGLKCNVVWITHESERRDKPTSPGQPGEYSGKIRPLMTGKVADSMNKAFTDWFRQMSCQKPTDYNTLTDDTLRNWKLNKDEFKAMCATFPNDTLYYWQTVSDNLFDAKAGSLVNPPKYLPANYQSFVKYQRKLKQ